MSVTINLPTGLVQALDDLVKETETTRTDVIQSLLKFGLDNVDEVFPLEDGEEEEGDEEEEEEEVKTFDPKKGKVWY